MDPLAEAMMASSPGGVTGRFVDAQAPWGFWLDETGPSTYVVVLEGACWLRRPAGPPIRLGAGDFALVRADGSGYGLASSPEDGSLTLSQQLASYASRSTLDLVEIPGDGPATSIVCGGATAEFEPCPLLGSLPPLILVPADRQGGRWMLDETLRLLAVELRRDRLGAQIVRERLVDVLFVHGMRAWLSSPDDEREASSGVLADPAVMAAVACVQADPTRAWTIRALAAEVGLSRATFTRRFTACLGEPPFAYVTRWRLALAARRLRETDDSLAAIAREIGYSSEFTFSRAFARTYNQPPGRYRTERQQSGRTENEPVGDAFASVGYGAIESASLP